MSDFNRDFELRRAQALRRFTFLEWLIRRARIIVPVLIILGIGGDAWHAYGTVQTITVEVTDKDRVVTGGENPTSYWLVFTREHDVLKNADSTWHWKFNSSSIQGRLERGKTYRLKIYGWRIPFLSAYPNIISIVE